MEKRNHSQPVSRCLLRLLCLSTAFVLLFPVFASPVAAQIFFGGLAEIDIRKGERDSSPYINQTPNSRWTLFTPRIRLNFAADITGAWFVEGGLQADHYYSEELSDPFIAMLSIHREFSSPGNLTFSAGSFPTPFGSYADDIHLAGNPFIQLPAIYARGMPVSRQSGLYGPAGDQPGRMYNLSMVYRRAYSHGLQLRLADPRHHSYDIRLAATLKSVSGYGSLRDFDRPAWTGRAVFQPVIWLRTGFSFSHGPYMNPDAQLRSLLPGVSFGRYTQSVFALDTEITVAYLRLLLEGGWNRWMVPAADDEGNPSAGPYHAENWFGMAEIQYNFPFFPGMYAAFRAESLRPQELRESGAYLYTGEPGTEWAHSISRFEWVIGRKISRDITLKTSWMLTDNRNSDLEDSVFSIQLSVLF